MAKHDDFSYSGFEFTDEYDMDNLSSPLESKRRNANKTREAVTDFTGGAYEGAVESLTDTQAIKNDFKKTLPSQFTEIFDAYDATSASMTQLYDHAEKELSTYVGDITKKIDSVVPERLSAIKKITTALKDKFAKTSYGSYTDSEETQISNILSQTFSGMMEAQQQQEQIRSKEELVTETKFEQNEQVRHLEMTKMLSRMDVNINKYVTYNERVGQVFQKKSLEINIRQYLTQQKILKELREGRLEQTQILKGIGKNTGLPDAVKLTMTENFTESMKRRTIGSIQDRLFGEDSLFKTAMDRFTKDVKTGIDNARTAMMMASMGVDSAADFAEMMQSGDFNAIEMAGTEAGKWLGNKIREKGIKKVSDRLSQNEKFVRGGYKAAAMISDPREAIEALRNSERFKNARDGQGLVGSKLAGGADKALDYISRLFNPERGDTSLQSTEGLGKAMKFAGYSQRTDNILTKAIPSYLARILQQVTLSNTPTKKVSLMTYDPFTGELKESAKLGIELKEKLSAEYAGSTMEYQVGRLANMIGQLVEGTSPDDSRAMAHRLGTEFTDTVSAGKIKNSALYEKAGEKERKILDAIAEKIGQDTIEGDQTKFALRKQIEDVRRNTTSFGASIQKMLDEGLGPQLLEHNLVIRKADGSYSLNTEEILKLQRGETSKSSRRVRSDVNVKENIKQHDPRTSLSGIKNIPIKTWNYIKDRFNRPKVGPMAQDVRKELGEEQAPGGTQLDLVSMNGTMMAAIQQLAKDQDEIRGVYKKSKKKNLYSEIPQRTLLELRAIRMSIDGMHQSLKDKMILGLSGLSLSMDPKKLKELMESTAESVMGFGKKAGSYAGDKASELAEPLVRTGNAYFDTLQSLVISTMNKGFKAASTVYKEGADIASSTKDFVKGVLPGKEEVQKEIKHLLGVSYRGLTRAVNATTEFLFTTLPNKVEALGESILDGYANFKTRIKTAINGPRDIYVGGQSSPSLLAIKMRSGFYYNAKTGTRIENVDDVLRANEDIVDGSTQEIALRWSDTANGLFDIDGNELKTVRSHLVGFAFNAIGAGVNFAKKSITSASKWWNEDSKLLDSIKNIGKSISGSFKGMSGVSFTDKRELGLLAQIRDLMAWGKPQKVIRGIYGRDLKSDKYLDGDSYLAELFGDKFKDMFGTKIGDAVSSLTSSGSEKTEGAKKDASSTTTKPFDMANAVKNFERAVDKWKDDPRGKLSSWFKSKTSGIEGSDSFVGPVHPDSKKSWAGKKLSSLRERFIDQGPNDRPSLFGKAADFVKNRFSQKKESPLGYADSMMSKLKAETDKREGSKIDKIDSSLKSFVGELRGIFGKFRGGNPFAAQGPAGGDSGFVGPMLPGGAKTKPGMMGKMKGLARGLPGLAMNVISGAGSLLGGLLGGSKAVDRVSTTEDMHQYANTAPEVAIRGKRDGNEANDSDGDGYRDGSHTEQAIKQQNENRQRKELERQKADAVRREAKENSLRYKGENVIDKMLGSFSSVMSKVSSGISTLFDMATTFLGTKGLGRFLSGALNKGKGLAKGAFSLGKRAVGGVARLATTVGRPLVNLASRAGTLSRIATVARVGQVAALASGGGLATAAGSLVGTVGAVLSSPFVLGALAIGASVYGVYRLYKYATRNNLTDFQRMRALQYGLTEESSEAYKVIRLEEYLEDGKLIYRGGNVTLNTKVIDETEMLGIFDIDKEDEDRVLNFTRWFGSRFIPFFLRNVGALNGIDNKKKLKDLDSLDAEQLKTYLDKAKFLDGPYGEDTSPFEKTQKLPNTKGDVEKVAEMLKNKKIDNKKTSKSLTDTVTTNSDLLRNEAEKKKLLDGNLKERTELEEKIRKNRETRREEELKNTPQTAKDVIASGANGIKVVPPNVVGEDGGKQKYSAPLPDGQSQKVEGGSTPTPAAPGGLYPPTEGLNHIVLGKDAKLEGLHPLVYKNFLAMASEYGKMTGKKIQVNEAARSYERQSQLYKQNPGKAAKPGSSLHERGLAIDIPSVVADSLEKAGLMTKYGFTRPVGGETWHIEPAGIQQSIQRAKTDPEWTNEQIKNSPGRGGGGYGSKPGTPLGKRNPADAKALWDRSVGNPVPNIEDPAKVAEESGPKTAGTSTTGTQISSQTPEKPTPATNTVSFTKKKEDGAVTGGGASATTTTTSAPSASGASGAGDAPASNPLGQRYSDTQYASTSGKPQNESVAKTKEEIIKAAKEAGADPKIMLLMAAAESSMGQAKKAPNSSARGTMQFIDSTWNEQLGKHGKKYGLDRNTSRDDTRASVLMAAEYMRSNRSAYSGVTDTPDIFHEYMPHLLGAGGARTFFNMRDEDIPAKAMPKAANSNKNLFFDRSGKPLNKAEVTKLVYNKFNKLAKDFGIEGSFGVEPPSSTTAGASSGMPPAANDSSSVSVGKTTAQTPEEATVSAKTPAPTPAAVEEPPKPREYLAPRKTTNDNAITANKSMANGIEPLLRESVDVQSKIHDTISTDMLPLMKSINDTLLKMYQEGSKAAGGDEKPSDGGSGTNTQKPKTIAESSNSVLSRERRFG